MYGGLLLFVVADDGVEEGVEVVMERGGLVRVLRGGVVV